MRSEQEPTETVALPTHVVAGVEQRLPRTEFDSVDAYVAFVMEEVLAHVEADDADEGPAVDRDQVEARLESLGYLE